MLQQAREAAKADGVSLSAYAESALLDKMMRNSARIAASHERRQGRDTDDYFAQAEAERAAMADVIHASGAAW